MVSIVGLLVIAGIPTTVGVCEGLSAQKKANTAAKEKAKFNLTATISLDGERFEECYCVLKDGRLWIDHPDEPVPAHRFQGWYFQYPSEAGHLGMVSFVSDDPPALNWIYVDKDSHMVRHGSRQETIGHVIGPWGWSSDEQWLTLEGDDSKFVAVEQENKKWCIFYDRDGRIQNGGDGEDGEEDTLEDEEEGGEGKPAKRTKEKPNVEWLPVKLRRRMMLGMESRYVKGANG
ncbi:hypothetical protein CONLIGDRAFT_678932 [Coniochaeta ligniaria NRRL 30616]|uniref:Fucose-specific lectin n=1 Tax=Coniochaeta ligniaria NRRL 30616 TaxID=1408157 RepID=A0A1J7IYG4_9PEZI|nr:hypothetical protein CONLIGDRAFT_678932 [Coniochaeta ligniaria NRRL 30616]